MNFKPSGMYEYNTDFTGDRKKIVESSNVKIASTPSDGRNYLVTIFRKSDNLHLWGVEVVYPTHTMTMTEFNEESISLETNASKQRLELFYGGIEISRIRFHDEHSGSFCKFIA